MNEHGATAIANWRDAHGNGLLHLMARSGSESVLSYLLEGGHCCVNGRNDRDETPLVCANYARPLIVGMLLKHGADVRVINANDQTPLHLAVGARCLESVALVLDAGVELDLTDRDDRTALYLAVEGEMMEIAKTLLEWGADLYEGNNGLKSVLSLAARARNVPLVTLLLNYGANVTHINSDGTSPLHFAVWLEETEITRYMIERGADIHKQDSDGFAVMHEAVYEGNLDQVKLLLESGADIAVKTLEGDTPLHWAAFGNTTDSPQVMKYLMEQGADSNDRDIDGTTPLHFALKRSELPIVHLFLSYKGDLLARNHKGETALHFAAENQHTDVIDLVLRRSAIPVDECNEAGFTALHYAAESGNDEGCTFLLSRGARIDAKCCEGHTPLFLAARMQQVAALEVLLEHGASVDGRNQEQGKSIMETVLEHGDGEIARILLRHLARLECQGFKVGQKDRRVINKDDVLRIYYRSCVREVRKMREWKIYGDVSFLDILAQSRTVIAGYARNGDLVRRFKKVNCKSEFPKYFKILGERFDEEVRWQRLLTQAGMVLGEIFNFNDPRHIVNQKILSYLKEEDLKRFVTEV